MKKYLLIALSAVIVVSCVIGGTFAYLTDRDSKTNVFTIGNVDITLNEDFEQDSALIPGVDIEKKPTIENTGKNDAWVWATIAVPAELDNDDASKNIVHFNYYNDHVNDTEWTWKKADNTWNIAEQEIDGVIYNVYTVLYQTALKPGEETSPVIHNVYLDKAVDIDAEGNLCKVVNGNVTEIDWNINTDGAPKIFAAAYAIQNEGFDNVRDAYAAYSAQWGNN